MCLQSSIILTVTDRSVLLLYPVSAKQNAISCAHLDDADEVGALHRLFQEHRDKPVIIIADTSAQRFQRDRLPETLSTKDAGNLAKRRLSAQLSGIDYKTVSLSSKNAVYIGIEKCDALSKVLGLLPQDAQDRLTIASAASEGARLLLSIDKGASAGWSALGVITDNSSRLTIIKDGLLTYSSLRHHVDIDRQITEARRYLVRYGLTDDKRLETYIIANGTIATTVPVNRFFSTTDIAMLMNLPLGLQQTDQAMNSLYALYLAKQKDCAAPIRTKTADHSFRMLKITNIMLSIARTLFLASTILFIIGSIDMFTGYLSAQHVLKEISVIKTHIALRYAHPDNSGIDLETLQLAADTEHLFSQEPDYGNVLSLLSSLSESLSSFGQTEKLEWHAGKLALVFPSIDSDSPVIDAAAHKLQEAQPALDISYSFINSPPQSNVGKKIRVEIKVKRNAERS